MLDDAKPSKKKMLGNVMSYACNLIYNYNNFYFYFLK